MIVVKIEAIYYCTFLDFGQTKSNDIIGPIFVVVGKVGLSLGFSDFD